MKDPKEGEFWIVQLHNRESTIVLVARDKVYPCGDEQGWPRETAVTKWVRKVRLS